MGTSLLRMELLGEQGKAAQEVVGHPASPVVTASWQLPAVGAVSRPCEAGTWERPWPHRPVTVGQHTWECFFPMNTELGGGGGTKGEVFGPRFTQGSALCLWCP